MMLFKDVLYKDVMFDGDVI